jgi:hypothetical protein
MFRRNLQPPSSGSKTTRSNKAVETDGKLSELCSSTLKWSRYVLPKRRAFSELHGVTTPEYEEITLKCLRGF